VVALARGFCDRSAFAGTSLMMERDQARVFVGRLSCEFVVKTEA